MWDESRRSGASALIGTTILLSALATAALGQSPVTVGSWATLPYQMPIDPIHCELLRNGKVLIVAGSENDSRNHKYRAAVWNRATGAISVQNLLWDVFCNGMAALPDGRVLIVGGTESYASEESSPYGEARATVFDPATEKFNEVQSTAHGRWYATVTTLSDGRLMAFSGYNELGAINKAVEFYDVRSGWSPEFIAPWSPPLYPREHLLPSGKVFYSGATSYSHLFDPTAGTWKLNIARTVYADHRGGGSSVLLPLRPQDGYVPRVLILGGHNPATATAEIIDLSAATPAWRMTAPMSKPRIQLNAVLLPNGKVLALGGSEVNLDASSAALAAELFDPATETWSPAGVARYPRLYHSVALLLPEGTVWTAGSNPERGVYEKNMEIYSPPYLFTNDASGNAISAARPVITSVPSQVGYGATFAIQTPDAREIESVVLIRLGSSSHAFDMEQRLVGLSFNASADGALSATAPPNGAIAPPGYYMLFLLRAGVPSVAKFVRLTTTPYDQPPKGSIISPASNVTIHAGQSVRFDASATDSDGTIAGYSWIFPDGNPAFSSARSPGLVTFGEVGTHVVSMTAYDDRGVNDPSPPTRTIVVRP